MSLEKDMKVEPDHHEMAKADLETRVDEQSTHSPAEEKKLVRSIDLQ